MMEGYGNDITTRHLRFNVIPAKAGIQGFVPWSWMDARPRGGGEGDPVFVTPLWMDSRIRGNDERVRASKDAGIHKNYFGMFGTLGRSVSAARAFLPICIR